jgi:hypothetical protein
VIASIVVDLKERIFIAWNEMFAHNLTRSLPSQKHLSGGGFEQICAICVQIRILSVASDP